MPTFFNSDLGELAHQLTLSPRRLRVEQLRGIEELLGLIEPDRAYPYDFACFHITGYRKRGPSARAAIPGKALICDLVTMAELISRRANISLTELDEPYKTQQDVAKRLNVSTKTVRRWRNRGLLGIRVVFADGVNRLAFGTRVVDRFVARNKEIVARGASFTQLTAAEREGIVARAHEILASRPLKLHAVARMIAEETGRAVETVRYTLRRYQEQPGAAPLLGPVGEDGLTERHRAMWRCREAGESTDSIARAFGCGLGDVGSVLREVQVVRWQQAPLEFIHNELFDAPNADELILHVPEPEAVTRPAPKVPNDTPPYLRSLYRTPLLTREQEGDLFRRYNYLKYKTALEVKSLDPETATDAQVDTTSKRMTRIDSLRERITRSNLRLVVGIAKKHAGRSTNFFEVVSDGNMSLMRAIEKFDYARGNKFSTYATWAVVKNYARSIPERHYHSRRYVTGQDELLAAATDRTAAPASDSDRKRVRELIATSLKDLSAREREIINGHFGLAGVGGSLTLEQLGRRFGVTKERVRQIERKAIGRLRELLSPSLADALAG